VKHEEPSVEQFAQLDTASVVGALGGARRDLGPSAGDGDGVVPSDDAFVATSESPIELSRGAAPGGGGIPRGMGEAAVEVLEESGKEPLGVVGCGEVKEPQFAGEAILKCVPEPLDASLGLGTLGGDVADGEFLEHLAEVGWLAGSGEFFLQGPAIVVSHEDAEAVTVELHRKAPGLGEAT
jgi:hypothetical protein